MSQFPEWAESVRKQSEESLARQALVDARADKIIAELEAVDPMWFMNYEGGSAVARCYLDTDHTDPDRASLLTKRNIVNNCIIPAAMAMVRAGLLQPTQEEPE